MQKTSVTPALRSGCIAIICRRDLRLFVSSAELVTVQSLTSAWVHVIYKPSAAGCDPQFGDSTHRTEEHCYVATLAEECGGGSGCCVNLTHVWGTAQKSIQSPAALI